MKPASERAAAKQVHIQYFAVLREQRGVSEEMLRTRAATLRELYAELRAAHGFSLALEQLGVAVNERFSRWDDALRDTDSVVFIPPVAGG